MIRWSHFSIYSLFLSYSFDILQSDLKTWNDKDIKAAYSQTEVSSAQMIPLHIFNNLLPLSSSPNLSVNALKYLKFLHYQKGERDESWAEREQL